MIAATRRFLLRLTAFLGPDRAERSLDREIASHLAMLEDDFRRRGLSPDQAARAARRALDGVDRVKDLQRDARSFVWLEDARRDLVYAARTLARTPGFTAVAVLTLALGIGASTIIYSVIHDLLIDPLPYPDAHRFVNVYVQDMESNQQRNVRAADEFLDFQEQSDVFEAVMGTWGEARLLDTPGGVEVVRAVLVTPNFFEVMGLPPLLGRVAGPADAAPDAPPVAVLRHRAWVAHFGARPDIVGRTIRLNGEPRTVVGVMPPRFTWHAADVWIPAPIDRAAGAQTVRNFQARLARGATLEQAEAQLTTIARQRARARPDEYPTRFRVRVVNVIEGVVGDFRGVLYTALGAVVLLLLIACCNVANMLLARATVREREMTLRAALGAGRGRIIRQLLVESLLLAGLGAIGGCLLAFGGLRALVGILPQGPLPGEVEFGLDAAALAFSLGVAVLSALAFGVVPAVYGARRDLVQGLGADGRTATGGRARLRNGLVVAEIALSLVLLLGAGVLLRSFASLVNVDLGFDPDDILVVSVAFPPGETGVPDRKGRFYEQALSRLSALPGVEAAAASTGFLPPFGGYASEIEIPARPATARPTAFVQICTSDYFRVLDVAVLRGRTPPAQAWDSPSRTAVVNRTFMDRFLRPDEVIGTTIGVTVPGADTSTPERLSVEIVGVVEDVRNDGLGNAPAPQVYLTGGIDRGTPLLSVRTSGRPLHVLPAVRREIRTIDPDVAIWRAEPLEWYLEFSYAQPRFSLIVLGAFAAVGTLLVAIGVFSVMAYTVSRQTREIAVRMALGADRRHVLGVVTRLGGRLVGVGIVVGLAASAATGRVIASQLWNTSPYDPLAATAAVLVVIVVAVAACYLPARRATRIDPVAALRHE